MIRGIGSCRISRRARWRKLPRCSVRMSMPLCFSPEVIESLAYRDPESLDFVPLLGDELENHRQHEELANLCG